MNSKLVGIGTLLVFAGFFPTPDDVTIISPVIQILGGASLIAVGLVTKEGKE